MPFDGTNLSQVKRDLIAARELLIEKGWVSSANSEGPYCLGMAVYRGACDHDNDRTDQAMGVLKVLLGFAPLDRDGEIFDWNDAQTSIEPVLALLDEAIAAA